MPYRRLPNTDKSRLISLKIAFRIARETHPNELAFSQSTYAKIRSFISNFEQALQLYHDAYDNQIKKQKTYNESLKIAQTYISHFIQVLNLAILRNELPQKVRKYYGIDIDNKKIPVLNTEKDIIKWGECIMKGEKKRISLGGIAIHNPRIAIVKIKYDNFIELTKYQKMVQGITKRSNEKVVRLREQADNIILDIWNEVEKYYSNMSSEEKREKAQKYGIIYVYRKNKVLASAS